MTTTFDQAVTLSEAMELMDDDWKKAITVDFIRNSFFTRHVRFHSLKNPVTNGAGLVHRLTRLSETFPVDYRDVNQSYDINRVRTKSQTVQVKIFGGSFQVDRVIAKSGTLESELYLQMSQLALSTARLFDQTCVIGDSTVNHSSFDGLLKWAEVYDRVEDGKDIDLTTMNSTNAKTLLNYIDDWLSTFDQRPTFIGGNRRTILALRAAAREIGLYTTTRDQWGHNVMSYDGIELVDFGKRVVQSMSEGGYAIDAKEILPIENNRTSLVAGRFGMDAIYGICPSSMTLMEMWRPRFDGNNVEVVQTGGVEMLAALVVNKVNSIGVLGNIQIKDDIIKSEPSSSAPVSQNIQPISKGGKK